MTLADHLLAEDKRPAVVNDCVHLVDSEVSAKRGFSGAFIKTTYKVVKALDGGRLVPKAVNDLLPDFAQACEPQWQSFQEQGGGDFESFCRGKESVIADALLAVTDGKAEHAKNQVLKKAYYKLRPKARENIVTAVPGLARVVSKHTR